MTTADIVRNLINENKDQIALASLNINSNTIKLIGVLALENLSSTVDMINNQIKEQAEETPNV